MSSTERIRKWDEEEVYVGDVREDHRGAHRSLRERLLDATERIGQAYMTFFPYL